MTCEEDESIEDAMTSLYDYAEKTAGIVGRQDILDAIAEARSDPARATVYIAVFAADFARMRVARMEGEKDASKYLVGIGCLPTPDMSELMVADIECQKFWICDVEPRHRDLVRRFVEILSEDMRYLLSHYEPWKKEAEAQPTL